MTTRTKLRTTDFATLATREPTRWELADATRLLSRRVPEIEMIDRGARAHPRYVLHDHRLDMRRTDPDTAEISTATTHFGHTDTALMLAHTNKLERQ